ncbi:hypothetical protein QYE76_051532 [Lolium multiflorum]|uniref:Integrase zinc-binding domain-containing protein n=1 Tax=Lolium multiflorum TaxID=4521 RepID=A0AAD8SS18_LOLMU|nr:hypothetical protein QYE76_051532 [Lolium multiflorum]
MQSNPEAPKMEALMVSVFEIKCVPSWAQEFLSYLTDGVLPDDRVQAKQIERRAKAYTIINHQLYKRIVSGVFQRCVTEGIELLREIHQGECGHHASSRAIVGKAFRHGFYWPTALKDAEEMVKTCNGCQRFAKQRQTPASALKTIPITWPFAVWGLDMVGPFRTARGGMTPLVMIDKFTKWIEAKPIKKLDGSTVAVTFLKEIIRRRGGPAWEHWSVDRRVRLWRIRCVHHFLVFGFFLLLVFRRIQIFNKDALVDKVAMVQERASRAVLVSALSLSSTSASRFSSCSRLTSSYQESTKDSTMSTPARAAQSFRRAARRLLEPVMSLASSLGSVSVGQQPDQLLAAFPRLPARW